MHEGAIMNCDSAWHYFRKIVLKPTAIYISIKVIYPFIWRKIDYKCSNHKAIVQRNIVLKDRDMQLKTEELHYF